MSGRNCPECGTPRGADGAPDCACAQRASDAARDVRSAEAAAAEDFDPLRIRPYVSLPDAEPGPGPEPEEPGAPVVPAVYAGEGEPPREGDLDLFAGEPGAAPAGRDGPDHQGDHADRGSHSDQGDRNAAADEETYAPLSLQHPPLPLPLPVPDDGYDPDGGHDPEHGFGTDAAPDPDPDERAGRRRTTLLAVAGAAVAVVAVTAFASGLFSRDTKPERALPDRTTGAPVSVVPSASPSTSKSARPSPSASPSKSASPTPSKSPTPTRSASPTARPSTASATGTVSTPSPTAPAVLREGDSGPEVRELQQRLKETYLYSGPANGQFDTQVKNAVQYFQWSEGIESDEQGVYGPATRQALESQTEEP